MNLKPLCAIFLILFSFLSEAQKEIRVSIIDSSNNQPVSFATIRFLNTNRGLVADYDGEFRLPYNKISDLPQLYITSLGFKPLTINPVNLSTSEINILKLTPSIESLDIVILDLTNRDKTKGVILDNTIKRTKKLLALDIVERAIEKIPENLNQKPHSTIGYYRDYQFVTGEYYNLNEGIIEQFDGGILTDKIKSSKNSGVFYSLKQNNQFKSSELYAGSYDNVGKYVQNAEISGYNGNELSILNTHNPIRNFNRSSFSYVYQLNKDFIFNHKFYRGDISFIDEEPIMKITFHAKKKSFKPTVTAALREESILENRVAGELLISLRDFSIYKFSYKMYDRNVNNPLFNVSIEYRKQNKKMYLNYISFNNRFVIAEDFTFSHTNIIYNKNEQYFTVMLNNAIDINSVKRKNFKVRYKGKRITVKKVDVISKKEIKVKVDDVAGVLSKLTKDEMPELSFRMKKIKDINGREINIQEKVNAYQFREYFVQEVFENKLANKNLKSALKTGPIIFSAININKDIDKYIINSPLIKRKLEK